MTQLVQLIVLPEVNAVVLTIMSQVAVPTDPSQIAVPPDWVLIRNQAAVPVASALVSSVMALAVKTPEDAAGKLVADMVSVPSNVCAPTAVSGVAGCEAV